MKIHVPEVKPPVLILLLEVIEHLDSFSDVGKTKEYQIEMSKVFLKSEKQRLVK